MGSIDLWFMLVLKMKKRLFAVRHMTNRLGNVILPISPTQAKSPT